ncbi:MAG: 3-hydroxyacyl-CoA dehydrogenase NAD-binding domain-containing protein [Acidimicrobiales bacterium]
MTALTRSVSLERDDEIALVVIDNPPVNALSRHVRQGMLEGIEAAAADASVTAVVLVCAGRTFIAGADITEFGAPPKAPGLREVQDAMERCPKPLIAAIHGTALGGGLEVAMCAHHRVAVASARFGQPEVKLGLLPGAGGTQRLPRIVGVAKALEMCAVGEPIDASDALEHGLIDEIIEGPAGGGDVVEALTEAARRFARAAVEQAAPLTLVRDLRGDLADVANHPGIFSDFRDRIARRTRGFLAPELNIRAIEAAVDAAGDFEAGLAREGELFAELMAGSQSAAQRYYFFAERQVAKIPDVPKDTTTLPLCDEGATCGILGAGTMGGGIAMNFANVGIPVTLVDRDQAALDRGLAVIRKNYERSATRGRISADDVEARMALITPALDTGAFATSDIVIEAVFEDMALKKAVFAELDSTCGPEAVLATNTSALDVNSIAAVTERPESVIGMHFFSPANVMKLLEVVRGDKTSKEVIASAMTMGRRVGKIPVLVGVCNGFVGNRMLFQRRLEADRIILEGATPAQVDRVLYDFGMPMEPFAMSDLAGLDIGWKAETSTGSTVREILCESGRRGQKNGRGYYTYDADTRASTPDPEVEQMIRDFAVAGGIEQRTVSDDEVLERCLYPMVNEGAKILDEGIAIRPGDIDVVWVNGYGWPVYRGGPMFWADTVGLPEVLDRIHHYHATLGGDHWAASGLLQKLADEGATFQTMA